jgi:hypothetical protein
LRLPAPPATHRVAEALDFVIRRSLRLSNTWRTEDVWRLTTVPSAYTINWKLRLMVPRKMCLQKNIFPDGQSSLAHSLTIHDTTNMRGTNNLVVAFL